MTRNNQNIFPAASITKKQRPAAVSHSVRKVHRHATQALRIARLAHFRARALVTGIEYRGDDLYIALFEANRDCDDHWILRARLDTPVREALEDQVGGHFGQPYLAADIVADVELALTKQFSLEATITGIVTIRPYRDL